MRFKLFILGLILLGVVSIVFAQPPPPDEEGQPRKKLRQWVQFRMVQELDLSEEQSLRFFPRHNDLEELRSQYGKEKRTRLDNMRKLIDGVEDPDNPDSETLKKLESAISEYGKMEEEFLKERNKREAAMLEVLTTVQKAKFLIFRATFENELREMIRDTRGRRGHKPGGRGPQNGNR